LSSCTTGGFFKKGSVPCSYDMYLINSDRNLSYGQCTPSSYIPYVLSEVRRRLHVRANSRIYVQAVLKYTLLIKFYRFHMHNMQKDKDIRVKKYRRTTTTADSTCCFLGFHFDSEDGGSMFVRNVAKYLPDFTVSRTR
jgi:hypothetical protein